MRPARQARLPVAVKEIVQKQIELGIDIVDDGEYSKPSFVTYVNERLGGFEVDKEHAARGPWVGSREALSFPEFYAQGHVGAAAGPHGLHRADHLQGPCAPAARHRQPQGRAQRREGRGFMPAISPSNIEEWQRNAYYKTSEEYLVAIAEAMREEYKAIVDAGFLLQIDDPRLVSYYLVKPDASIAECRKWANARASKCSTMRCAASRRRKSATTPATASTWGRACTTWRSSTSSTSS